MATYREILARVPLLQSLSSELREHIVDIVLSISLPRTLRRGEQLYAEGAEDTNTGAMLVEGALLVASGANRPVVLSAPELLGEMQQFNAYGTRTATVCAKTEATVLEFSWHDFVARVLDRPSISQADRASLRAALERIAGERFKRL